MVILLYYECYLFLCVCEDGKRGVKLLTDSPDGGESPASESSHSWYHSDSSVRPSKGPDCMSNYFYVSSNSKVLPNPYLCFSVPVEYRETLDVLGFY